MKKVLTICNVILSIFTAFMAGTMFGAIWSLSIFKDASASNVSKHMNHGYRRYYGDDEEEA